MLRWATGLYDAGTEVAISGPVKPVQLQLVVEGLLEDDQDKLVLRMRCEERNCVGEVEQSARVASF
jgi:hypothetical protein